MFEEISHDSEVEQTKANGKDIFSCLLQLSDYAFFKEGEYWTISYEGKIVRLKDAIGLKYIAYLLSNPGKGLHWELKSPLHLHQISKIFFRTEAEFFPIC